VARMREFYRPREAELVLSPVDLNEVAQDVIELTRARWSDMPQQRGIVIEVITQLEEDLPLVNGNAAELREAVTNLIFNAVDAMPQGGKITIRTASSPDPSGPDLRRVMLEVADNGVGMDEDTRRRCLEPFFTTKGERGTGLGLAMVYGTVQRHKAALEIDSAPGKGTRMRLEFTATRKKVEPPAPVAALSEIAPLRLLLVDDDPAVLHSTRVVLELDGHTVVAADGGAAGIEALQEAKDGGQSFDVVVTDLGMPYVDGRSVARAIKDLSRGTPVVLLTGWGQRLLQDGDIPPNVDHVLSKPPKLRLLRGVLAQCCAAAVQTPAQS